MLSRPRSVLVVTFGGVVLVGIGLHFALLRPHLVAEDARFMGVYPRRSSVPSPASPPASGGYSSRRRWAGVSGLRRGPGSGLDVPLDAPETLTRTTTSRPSGAPFPRNLDDTLTAIDMAS